MHKIFQSKYEIHVTLYPYRNSAKLLEEFSFIEIPAAQNLQITFLSFKLAPYKFYRFYDL